MLEDVLVSQAGGADVWSAWSLNLAAAAGITPATNYGVVGAPAALQVTTAQKNVAQMLFVASGDGYVYALNTVLCFSQASPVFRGGAGDAPVPPRRAADGRATRLAMPRVELGRAAAAGALRGGLGAAAAATAEAFGTDGGAGSAQPAQWALYTNTNAVRGANVFAYPYAAPLRTTTWEQCRDGALKHANPTPRPRAQTQT